MVPMYQVNVCVLRGILIILVLRIHAHHGGHKLYITPVQIDQGNREFNRVFPILYQISRIRRIQLESVKHNWRLLEAFLCFTLTVGSVV